jgi:hypothetical protein
MERIKSSVIHLFLFSNLEPKDLEIEKGAMEEKDSNQGRMLLLKEIKEIAYTLSKVEI